MTQDGFGSKFAREGLTSLGSSIVSASDKVQNIKDYHGLELVASSIITSSIVFSCTYMLTTFQIGLNILTIAGKSVDRFFYFGNFSVLLISFVVGLFVVFPRLNPK